MKILLVDDDKLFSRMMSTTLSALGQVSVATDGGEALDKLCHDDYDLMITDIFMPNKEGIEVIRQTKSIHPNIKIIAISSGGSFQYPSFLKMAESFGADASLKKPFSPQELLETIGGLA